MTSLPRFFRKLQRLFGRDQFRDELTEEMAFHRAAAAPISTAVWKPCVSAAGCR